MVKCNYCGIVRRRAVEKLVSIAHLGIVAVLHFDPRRRVAICAIRCIAQHVRALEHRTNRRIAGLAEACNPARRVGAADNLGPKPNVRLHDCGDICWAPAIALQRELLRVEVRPFSQHVRGVGFDLSMTETIVLPVYCYRCGGAVQVHVEGWSDTGPELPGQTWLCPYCRRSNEMTLPGRISAATANFGDFQPRK